MSLLVQQWNAVAIRVVAYLFIANLLKEDIFLGHILQSLLSFLTACLFWFIVSIEYCHPLLLATILP